jgi:multiple sugar transport system permease protein
MKLQQKDTLYGLTLVLPSFIILGLIFFYPLLYTSFLSFYEKLAGGGLKYVGFQNFVEILTSKSFYNSIVLSTIYTVIGILGKLLVGLGFALFLNEEFKGRSFLRGLIILPWVIPVFATAMIWYWLFDLQLGPINIILDYLFKIRVQWISPDYALFSIIIVQLWKGIPFFTICLLAGLQGIPKELYDAAEVDGASPWKKFLHITLPELKYVIASTSLISGIWTFGEFTAPYMLTRGGPGDRTELIAVHIYKETFSRYDFGYSSAMVICLLPFLLPFILYVLRSMR